MSSLLTRYWLAGAILIAVAAALLFPGPAELLPKIHFVDVGVIAIMFLGSLKLTPEKFKAAAARIDLVLLSAVSVFAVAPLAALGIGWALGFEGGDDRIALLICAAQASTLATAIVLTEVAGGDVALAMLITVVNNLATVALTPLAFRLLGDAEVDVDYLAMAGEMAAKIVTPVLAAQLVRRWIGEWAKRHKRALSITSQLIILVYIYAGVAAAWDRLAAELDVLPRLLALVVALHAALLLFNALVARLVARQPGARAAFVLTSSQKTLPVAILIWQSHFPALPLGPLVAVAYHMLQLVVDSVAAPGLLRLPLIRSARRAAGETESRK